MTATAPVIEQLPGLAFADLWARLPWQVQNDFDARRIWRVVFERWRDAEDENGYYLVLESEWEWPMTYRTRAMASAAVAEYYADGAPELRARFEVIEQDAPIPLSRFRILVERIARPWESCHPDSSTALPEDDRYAASKRFKDGPKAERSGYHQPEPFRLPHFRDGGGYGDSNTYLPFTLELWKGLLQVVKQIAADTMKPTDEVPFGQLPLVIARTFELPHPRAQSPAHADEWVNHMREQPHLVVRRFWRTVKAGGAAVGLLVVVVRRKDGL